MVSWGVTPSSKSWVIEHDALFHQEKWKRRKVKNADLQRQTSLRIRRTVQGRSKMGVTEYQLVEVRIIKKILGLIL